MAYRFACADIYEQIEVIRWVVSLPHSILKSKYSYTQRTQCPHYIVLLYFTAMRFAVVRGSNDNTAEDTISTLFPSLFAIDSPYFYCFQFDSSQPIRFDGLISHDATNIMWRESHFIYAHVVFITGQTSRHRVDSDWNGSRTYCELTSELTCHDDNEWRRLQWIRLSMPICTVVRISSIYTSDSHRFACLCWISYE